MGDAIMSHIFTSKIPRILQNLSYINEVIERPLSEDIAFTTDGDFTIRDAFDC
jgi:hypothetical protein